MWCLLTVAVLLLSIHPTVTEVVQSISNCSEFLLNETSPNIPGVLISNNIQDQDRYKIICQTYDDTRRFVTLYDTENKIPVFSASKYSTAVELREEQQRDLWKIEPQLEDMKNDKNMEDCNRSIVYRNQASDNDYNRAYGYDKGHLIPVSYGLHQSDKDSTSTLTNAVPQVNTFNQGSWARMESCVKCILEKYCKNNSDIEGYVVTGAQPGTDDIINDRVNVPSELWSAFCCYSEEKKKWLSGAHWGESKENNKYMQMKTLEQLTTSLGVDVFPGTKCPRSETLHGSDLKFPKKQKCNCPPERSITG